VVILHFWRLENTSSQTTSGMMTGEVSVPFDLSFTVQIKMALISPAITLFPNKTLSLQLSVNRCTKSEEQPS